MADSTAEHWLRQMDDFSKQTKIPMMESLVLAHGRHFPSMPLSYAGLSDRAQIMELRWKVKPRQKDCYGVAARLAWAWNRLRYVEGYAHNNLGLTVPHAWAVLDGAVIDLTWRRTRSGKGDNAHGQQFVLGVYPDDWDYFGIEIPTVRMNEVINDTGVYGVLFSRLGQKMLKEGTLTK